MVNLFYLSADPVEAAAWYCDQHVTKMGLEAVQVVWTVFHLVAPSFETICSDYELENGKKLKAMKPLKNVKHPLVLWGTQCKANVETVITYGAAIFAEYTKRYKRVHVRQNDLPFLKKVDFYLKFLGV